MRISFILFFFMFLTLAQAQDDDQHVYTNSRTKEVFIISGKDTVNLSKIIKEYKPDFNKLLGLILQSMTFNKLLRIHPSDLNFNKLLRIH